MAQKEDCVFCKIARGEIPCAKIYEDKEHLAFLDINPFAKGHLLIIPKNHSKWLWDMKINEYIKLKERVHFLANVLRKAFDTDWVEEVIAGIGVQHTHIHLLPRQTDDGLGEVPIRPLRPRPPEKEMEEIAEKIRGKL